jgi:HSP20 family protein
MFGISRFNPWTELASLHRDLDSLFGRNFGQANQSGSSVEGFTPATEVRKDGDKWMVAVYIPGVSPKDVNIEVVGHTLRVSGERTHAKGVEPYVSEISYGKFEREFTVPSDIDADRVEARYHDGVLELTLPVKESAKPRRIEVATEPKQIKAA